MDNQRTSSERQLKITLPLLPRWYEAYHGPCPLCANCFSDATVHSVSSTSPSPMSCMALSSASFSCSSMRSTRRDRLSKGLGLTWISPLFAQRETLLGGKPNLCAATFIVTHCSIITNNSSLWILAYYIII